MKKRSITFDPDVPMDLAVANWRMINDKDFRDRWQNFGADCERWRLQAARDLLTACETLDYLEVYEFVKIHPPSAAIITGLVQLAKDSQRSKSAQKAAIQRHAENHAMKSEVFQWLESQAKFKSIEAAAMAITKQQPIAHVTARDWYKEWKKLCPTSTP
jgi:hypothetical protein